MLFDMYTARTFKELFLQEVIKMFWNFKKSKILKLEEKSSMQMNGSVG